MRRWRGHSLAGTFLVAFTVVSAAFVPNAHAGALDSPNATPTPPDAPSTPPAVQPPPNASSPIAVSAKRGEVVRAAFTTSVVDHEPQGTISELTTDHTKVYYFTELANMSGRRIIHRWEYNGKVMAEVPFDIGGPRWRVYSVKTLLPAWTGEWTASTVDENGRVLALNTLEYKR